MWMYRKANICNICHCICSYCIHTRVRIWPQFQFIVHKNIYKTLWCNQCQNSFMVSNWGIIHLILSWWRMCTAYNIDLNVRWSLLTTYHGMYYCMYCYMEGKYYYTVYSSFSNWLYLPATNNLLKGFSSWLYVLTTNILQIIIDIIYLYYIILTCGRICDIATIQYFYDMKCWMIHGF